MPKEIVVTGLGNRIEYATTNGKGLITGKREDITEQAIDAVFMHLKKEFTRKNPDGKGFGRNYGEHGSLLYLPDGVELAWKRSDEEVKRILEETYDEFVESRESK